MVHANFLIVFQFDFVFPEESYKRKISPDWKRNQTNGMTTTVGTMKFKTLRNPNNLTDTGKRGRAHADNESPNHKHHTDTLVDDDLVVLLTKLQQHGMDNIGSELMQPVGTMPALRNVSECVCCVGLSKLFQIFVFTNINSGQKLTILYLYIFDPYVSFISIY